DVTATTITSSANPATFGQGVTFTATVANASSSVVPGGTLQFYDGSTLLDTEVLNSSGKATSVPISALLVSSHSITAVYAGNSEFAPSTSAGYTQTVALPVGSIFVLNSQASGALTVSGNATVNLPGTLVVDSTSPSAISASGTSQITAAGGTLVVGGLSKTGN